MLIDKLLYNISLSLLLLMLVLFSSNISFGGSNSKRCAINKVNRITRQVEEATSSVAIAVRNFSEFLKLPFGKMISSNARKNGKRYQGQSIHVVSRNSPGGNIFLKKNDRFYLDALHKDHLEVFDRNGKFKMVLNLDGTLNAQKTELVRRQGGRTLHRNLL